MRQGEEEAALLAKAISRGRTLRQHVHQWIAEHIKDCKDAWILDFQTTETMEGAPSQQILRAGAQIF